MPDSRTKFYLKKEEKRLIFHFFKLPNSHSVLYNVCSLEWVVLIFREFEKGKVSLAFANPKGTQSHSVLYNVCSLEWVVLIFC